MKLCQQANESRISPASVLPLRQIFSSKYFQQYKQDSPSSTSYLCIFLGCKKPPHTQCVLALTSVSLARTQSLYPYPESTINSNIVSHLRLTILFLLSLFVTIMPCFIRLCPHYHLGAFPNAKVLLCILFGAAPLCLPMTYMKLVCSALQCSLCRFTVSFFC